MARQPAAAAVIGAAGLPGIAALMLGLLLFAIALVVARARRKPEHGGRRDAGSMIGIAVQGLGFVLAGVPATHVTLDPLGTAALGAAALVAIAMLAGLSLFVWASATMGRNWSLVARTREDHVLVTRGPFALMRHPIYTALALVVIALAIALGHVAALVIALPVYALGTSLRVRSEERLLHAMFGATYDAYAVRVKRFVPGVF